MHTSLRTATACSAASLALLAVLSACEPAAAPLAASTALPVLCQVELRSWVVAGRGRHLYLTCDCPDGYEHLEDRIEFTSAALREDFEPSRATDGLFRIARMTPGRHLGPMLAPPDNRFEAAWTLPVSTIERLQRDRVFALEYRLLGPNSNSAMRAVLEDADIPLPDRIATSGGMLGEFPGMELSPGEELPPSLWPEAGIAKSPQ